MKLYFTLKELNPKNYGLTKEQIDNLKVLIERLSLLREKYGLPMVVTSGVRSMQDQMRINPTAPKSKHLLGAAADISDRDGKLKDWIKKNVKVLEEIGLWCEHPDSTPTWVHFQVIAPKSGKRFFYP